MMVAAGFSLPGEAERHDEEAIELEPVFGRGKTPSRRYYGEGPYAREFETATGVGIPGTIHRLDCAAGCAPIAAGQCVAVLRRAILEAISMASKAARKLDEAVKFGPRTLEANKTADFFLSVFGHDPRRPVPWAHGIASGTSVAGRFRAVARELAGGRRIAFRCSVDDECKDNVAFSIQSDEPNVINLCPRFWKPSIRVRGLPPEKFRGGVIIHEMLHVLFFEFFHHFPNPMHDPEFRRDNAFCYEAFSYRVNGFTADDEAVERCRQRPA